MTATAPDRATHAEGRIRDMNYSLKLKVDALGQELASSDETTRRAVLERLDRASGLGMRRARRAEADRRDESLEDFFDNLPI
ncbi:hypothetical protein [Roseivivax sp. CAU 1761]